MLLDVYFASSLAGVELYASLVLFKPYQLRVPLRGMDFDIMDRYLCKIFFLCYEVQSSLSVVDEVVCLAVFQWPAVGAADAAVQSRACRTAAVTNARSV